MQNFMKTILSAFKTWTDGRIKNSTADWNENDSSADSYVKNRTHWEEIKDVVVLDNYITAGENSESTNISHSFKIGDMYTVICDGITYDNLIVENWEEEFNGIGGMWGDYSTYPFGICAGYSDISIYTSETHTITLIQKNISTIHTIDHKYLPDDIGMQADWNEEDESSKAYILNKPDVALQSDLETVNSNVSTALTNAATAQTTADTALTNAATAQSTADGKMSTTNPTGTGCFTMNGGRTGVYTAYAIGAGVVASKPSLYAHGKYNEYEPIYEPYSYKRNVDGTYCNKNTTLYISTEYELDTISGVFTLLNPISINTNDLYSNIASYWGYYVPIELTKSNLSGNRIDRLITNTYQSNVIAVLQGSMSSVNSLVYKFNSGGLTVLTRQTLTANGTYAHIVGNGTSDTERSNAHTLDWSGNGWFAGDVYVGSTSGTNRDKGSKKLATEEYVTASKPHFTLSDEVNGFDYIVKMRNGSLISFCKASSIEVTTQPTKTEYAIGETFDPTGMVITAICQDASTREIEGYAYTADAFTAVGAKNVTINYVEADVTYTTTVTVTVTEAVTASETETETVTETTE